MASKRDALMTTLTGQGYVTGSVSDRLYEREKAVYEVGAMIYGPGPHSLADYMVANGTDFNVLF